MYLMQECYITYFFEIGAVGVLAGDFPDIYTLVCQVAVAEISVPASVYIKTFVDQDTPPVENLKLVFGYIFQEWPEDIIHAFIHTVSPFSPCRACAIPLEHIGKPYIAFFPVDNYWCL